MEWETHFQPARAVVWRLRRLDEARTVARTMAKFKTELNLSRANDEMRTPEVTLDFTPNALASVLYKQGDTVVLACCTKERPCVPASDVHVVHTAAQHDAVVYV